LKKHTEVQADKKVFSLRRPFPMTARAILLLVQLGRY